MTLDPVMILTDVSISAMAAIYGRSCIDCDWCVSISAMAAIDGRSCIDCDWCEHLGNGSTLVVIEDSPLSPSY